MAHVLKHQKTEQVAGEAAPYFQKEANIEQANS